MEPTRFDVQIEKFNAIYRLPVPLAPTLTSVESPLQRLKDFRAIVREEIEEMDDVLQQLERGAEDLDVLVALADLLGDIQVYCASEARKFGIPNSAVLDVIMRSNFSKLDEDGQPIYDSRGKVMKGPNYWRPEPEIRALLSARASVAAA